MLRMAPSDDRHQPGAPGNTIATTRGPWPRSATRKGRTMSQQPNGLRVVPEQVWFPAGVTARNRARTLARRRRAAIRPTIGWRRARGKLLR